MIPAYEDYLPMAKSLSMENMAGLHKELIHEIGNDKDALDLYRELIETATRYAAIRAGWLLWTREERMDRDSSRTSCHNSLIVKFNQLAKYLSLQGRPAAWRNALGYEEDDAYNRKRVGDFGCYLVFINTLAAR